MIEDVTALAVATAKKIHRRLTPLGTDEQYAGEFQKRMDWKVHVDVMAEEIVAALTGDDDESKRKWISVMTGGLPKTSDGLLPAPKIMHSALIQVIAERVRQAEMWDEPDHAFEKWVVILAEEFGKLAQQVNKNPDFLTPMPRIHPILEKAITTAAVALAIVQQAIEETK